jgi:hypothetical protein
MSGSAKNFQLSQKRPSKVDLPKLTFKELDKQLRNETMVKFGSRVANAGPRA